jgi:hypothetical protein
MTHHRLALGSMETLDTQSGEIPGVSAATVEISLAAR